MPDGMCVAGPVALVRCSVSGRADSAVEGEMKVANKETKMGLKKSPP